MGKCSKSSKWVLGAAIALFAIALVPIIGGSMLGDKRMIFLHGGFFVSVGVVLLGLSLSLARSSSGQVT
jgi:UDP-N-acetylglucosamine enolpyruvyl transferase